MFIQLSKNGAVLLAVRTDHQPYNLNVFDHLPISYEGDVSLLSEVHEEAPARVIVNNFYAAATDYDLDITGDFEGCVLRLD
jgi:hypothetical protein